MEELVETITRGNVAEVKAVLGTVALAAAAYQVVLAAATYGKLRLGSLPAATAGFTHRSIGDALLVVIGAAAFFCLSVFGLEGFEEGGAALWHSIAGFAVLGVLVLKVAILRGSGRGSSLLPYLGTSAFLLLAVIWSTSVPEALSP